ncbi:hypothetical protein GC175_27580 [bacterium]|nr:hypothetical protein [bacterium]
MNSEWVLGLLLAGFWGIVWALVLQLTPWGRWAAVRRTWLTVVIGVGGTLVCGLVIFSWKTVLGFIGLFACSSLGIIGRSLINEWHQDRS